jgi:hypothetical protein
LLWDFLYHDCDHAGVWIVDFETAQIFIGKDMKVNYEDALKFFNSGEVRIVVLDGGSRWFIPSFIEFQYGKLSEKNRLHISVISILSKYDLLDESFNLKLNKPLISPLQGAKDKEQYKEKEKDKDKDKEIIKQKAEIVLPFNTIDFINAWENWKEYKFDEWKFKYKSSRSEQAALMELSTLANGNEHIAKQIILQSISKGWKGFFELKNTSNEKFTRKDTVQDLRDGFKERASEFLNRG